MIRIGLVLTLLTLFGLSACSKPVEESESKRIASETVVKAIPQRAEISAGGSGEAIVRVTIEKGYHVNANPPTYAYLKPTELVISPANGVSVGSVSYPAALTRKFEFAEKPLAVYEGEAELKVLLQADKSAARGERSVSAILRIQACDDQVCYPPGTIDLQIPVTIK